PLLGPLRRASARSPSTTLFRSLESWIYDEALLQAEDYLQMCGGTLDGLRVMQEVLQARGDIAAELKLLEGTVGGPPTVPSSSLKIGKHTSELQSRENLVCRLLL